jgi:putative DNA primase/helicase
MLVFWLKKEPPLLGALMSNHYSCIEDAALDACRECGLEPPKFFKRDVFQVVDVVDGKPRNGAGRVKVFADGQGGIVQNWRTGEKRSFFLNNSNTQAGGLSDQERQEIENARRKREAAEVVKHDQAAGRALQIWQAAKPAANDHPYLRKKQIKPHHARVSQWRRFVDIDGERKPIVIDNALLIPLFDASGNIRNLQAIFPEKHPLLNRDKDFLAGGALAGLFGWIGKRTDTVIICEGFATAATLYEQSANRTYMAFTAGSLLAVAKTVREKLPKAKIILAADNDTRTKDNVGLTKATEAALAVGGLVAVPPIPDADFNDYAYFLNGGDCYAR